MSATQLLRILETYPNNFKYETRIFDAADPNSTMKENAIDELWNDKLVENESRDSPKMEKQKRDLFGTDTNKCTDKNITDCELPELVISCKEVNYHIVKDICIDNGISKEEKKCGTKGGEDDKSLVPVEPKPADPLEGSFVNNALPLQEFGTRSFLRSFLNSLGDKKKEVPQPFDQISSVEENTNSKMEQESINENTEQSGESKDVHDQQVKDDNSDNNSSPESVKQSPDHNDRRSDDQSLGEVLFASHKDKSTTRNAHDWNPTALWDDGESSFSTGDHVSYSGPIPFSGSLSHRSDSSAATSTRSFAFPVLQAEWNSSPVKMAKPEKGHYRKQKDWRSGLLCCRF